MADSNIEWTDKVWNPVTGCTSVSEGCRNCYAKRMANRLKGRFGYPADDPFKVTLHPERLDEPQGWKKPRRIFVCSMSDLFHKDVPDYFISRVLNVPMRGAHRHTYLILTKRPDRAKSFLEGFYNGTGKVVACVDENRKPIPTKPCPRIYLGVSVEDQPSADHRIPYLLQTPAAKRFVSYEPALGPVDFKGHIEPYWECPKCHSWSISKPVNPPTCCSFPSKWKLNYGINQIIMGGETGPGARPMHPDWARSVRDQCVEADVPFFFKQWGEWSQTQGEPGGDLGGDMRKGNVEIVKSSGENDGHFRKGDVLMRRVGKKNAGHLLDGKEHRGLI